MKAALEARKAASKLGDTDEEAGSHAFTWAVHQAEAEDDA
jgi:hypothetical protein